jgi:hypothetical protein
MPLTPAEADLTGYDFMPLYGGQLFGSDFNLEASDAEFRIALRLWWAAWTQVPAASLPADEHKLCQLAGFERGALGKWRKVRATVMRNFVLCSDNRYYHRVLAPHAVAAWEERKAAIARGKASGVARRLKSKRSREEIESVSQTVSQSISTPSGKKFDLKSNKGEGQGELNPPVKRSNQVFNHPGERERLAALLSVCRATDRFHLDAKAELHIRQWATEGVTDQQLTDAIAIAKEHKGDQILYAAYLAPIVVEVRSGAARPSIPDMAAVMAEAARRCDEREALEAQDKARRELLAMQGANHAA